MAWSVRAGGVVPAGAEAGAVGCWACRSVIGVKPFERGAARGPGAPVSGGPWAHRSGAGVHAYGAGA
ncbi:hypothetical protein GCM10027073_06580 [Streptomyces chlorus]